MAKVESNVAPERILIESLPNGQNAVHLAENIELGDRDGEAVYSYDQYRLNVFPRPGLRESIEKNFDAWLATAKEREGTKAMPTIDERILAVEAENKKLLLENTDLKNRIEKVEEVTIVKETLEPVIIKDPIISK